MDIRKVLDWLKTRGFAEKYSPSQPRDEHGRWTLEEITRNFASRLDSKELATLFKERHSRLSPSSKMTAVLQRVGKSMATDYLNRRKGISSKELETQVSKLNTRHWWRAKDSWHAEAIQAMADHLKKELAKKTGE